MYDKFFEKQVDYFWEFEYPFAEFFLKELFEGFKRKYSLEGNGIYNLIYIDNKIYEVKFTEAKAMVVDDGKLALRDNTKNEIVKVICSVLNARNIVYTVNSGKFITFKIQNKYIAKLEIIKKLQEPK